MFETVSHIGCQITVLEMLSHVEYQKLLCVSHIGYQNMAFHILNVKNCFCDCLDLAALAPPRFVCASVYVLFEPPRFGGRTFAWGDVCQQMAKYQFPL